MIPKYKKALLLSSLLILLPIPAGLLLCSRFPAEFMDNWAFHVFLPPVSLLIGHWLCFFFTRRDPGNADKNQKPQLLVLWIMPLLSNLLCAVFYALLLGVDFSPFCWMVMGFGLLFAAIGNYLPKTRMNATIGIKVPWTYSSEANWNATHRFAGKLWVAGGLAMLPGVFLPEGAAIVLLSFLLVLMCLLPVLYAWRYYRKEKAEGKAVAAGYTPADKTTMKISTVFLAVLLIFTGAIMFSGDLEYRFDTDGFTIEADWYSDLTVKYADVESLEFRQSNVPGSRVGGFGSLRLLMGFFRNEELGNHIRYTYYDPQACIILTTDRQTFVLSGKTAEQTREIFDSLSSRIA